MEIICIQGSAPGHIVATVSHKTRVRQLPIYVERHPSGGWHVQQSDGEYGPRCHAVATAVLLEASEAFVSEDTTATNLFPNRENFYSYHEIKNPPSTFSETPVV